MTAERVTVLADHSLLLAVPAFAPAVVVVAVVLLVALRDRRAGDCEEHEQYCAKEDG
ncbi:hypothetical protein NDR87_11010 [Nocardia sp. CDC159]|uniref:Uncharacterized protein n=1 Tax=Nocardia pulmonis TaxID=2951408 RepID=A0A9X2E936_9NOCA|nr:MULTISPECIES: hypothetical protein [Nocardia]MCM6774001.1 hypothetical protein [Nocardia pulmonis]MCM6786888.1 hypothetical protein [Nocardia sp. CDC159]